MSHPQEAREYKGQTYRVVSTLVDGHLQYRIQEPRTLFGRTLYWEYVRVPGFVVVPNIRYNGPLSTILTGKTVAEVEWKYWSILEFERLEKNRRKAGRAYGMKVVPHP